MTEAPPAGIRNVAVVMPAHDEEQRLGRALSGLRSALDTLEVEHPGVGVSVTVVLDNCTDNSKEICTAFSASDPRFRNVTVKLRSAGASRDYGVRTALDGLQPPGTETGAGPETVWLANTDADSTVPRHWLVRQVDLANNGTDAVLGSVEPDPADVDPAVLGRWLALHPFREDHSHIYGANLGIRASAYLAVGGFPLVRSHEDRGLVERLRRHGFTVTSTDSIRVVTSGRTEARAPQGFAAYIRGLGAELPAAARG
ncbi:glycosyltransferase [Paenarthrobacter nicotinovorans]|uniref:glycosyltransferase n=1 Tax=Paenarthrobacter nicotinovorans TaxID=29320 RepID=UPI0004791101|nr:glycosyltransferase [Paenarthrobacter nicotinovorans]